MLKQLLNALNQNTRSAQMQSRMSTRDSFWLHQSFQFYFEDNGMYFLSSCVRAKPGIANDLTEADEIGKNTVVDFIDSFLVASLSFTSRFNATS